MGTEAAEVQEQGGGARRSPGYPAIPLDTALKRARELYAEEKGNAAAVETILHHWGYKPKSGAGLVTLAALKKYGLIVDEGSGSTRRARLSNTALEIIRDPRSDSPEREEAIRTAALRPTIHRELWEEFKDQGWPSEDTLEWTLKRKGFTDHGAREFIQQFKHTLAFAGLREGDTMPLEAADKPSLGGKMTPPPGTVIRPKTSTEAQAVAVTIPVPQGAWPVLNAPLPMPEEDWEAMLDYLKLMRPAFVKKPSVAPQEEQEQE